MVYIVFSIVKKFYLTLHPESRHLIFFENFTFNACMSNIFVETCDTFLFYLGYCPTNKQVTTSSGFN